MTIAVEPKKKNVAVVPKKKTVTVALPKTVAVAFARKEKAGSKTPLKSLLDGFSG